MAMRAFSWCWDHNEAREAAEYAVHIALLTYDDTMASLSTYVYWMSRRESQRLRRQKIKASSCVSFHNLNKDYDFDTFDVEDTHYTPDNTIWDDVESILEQEDSQTRRRNGIRATVLKRYFINGETQPEIARSIGVSQQCVNQYYQTAIETLREKY